MMKSVISRVPPHAGRVPLGPTAAAHAPLRDAAKPAKPAKLASIAPSAKLPCSGAPSKQILERLLRESSPRGSLRAQSPSPSSALRGVIKTTQRSAETALAALQIEHRSLQEKLLSTESKLRDRDAEVARLKQELEQLKCRLPQTPGIFADKKCSHDYAETPRDPDAEQLQWVVEIVEAREALSSESLWHKELSRRLRLLQSRMEAICEGRTDVSSSALNTIDGVLLACGLRQLPTPPTGNCQFYAFVEAATQRCLLKLKKAAQTSSTSEMILRRMEKTTAAVKRGIRGSALLSFDKLFDDSWFLDALVEEVNRSHQIHDGSDSSKRAILRGYFNDIATNASDVNTTVPSTDWGCALTVREGAKAMGRVVYVLTEHEATKTTPKYVTYSRVEPSDPSGVGSMFVSVNDTYTSSFTEWSTWLLQDLVATASQPDSAPVLLTLRDLHYSAVVLDAHVGTSFFFEERRLTASQPEETSAREPTALEPEIVTVEIVSSPIQLKPVFADAPSKVRAVKLAPPPRVSKLAAQTKQLVAGPARPRVSIKGADSVQKPSDRPQRTDAATNVRAKKTSAEMSRVPVAKRSREPSADRAPVEASPPPTASRVSPQVRDPQPQTRKQVATRASDASTSGVVKKEGDTTAPSKTATRASRPSAAVGARPRWQ